MLRRQNDIQFEMVLFISQTNTAFTLCYPRVIEIYCCSPVSAQNLCSHNIYTYASWLKANICQIIIEWICNKFINDWIILKLWFKQCITLQDADSSCISSSVSSLLLPLQTRHLQQTIHGAARSRRGDATSSRIPNPAKIPITCVRCQITDARECPSLFLHGPLS